MPLRTKIECPECGSDLVVKRGGVCPRCGARFSDHVARVRAREKRIEQVVAVVGTILVVGVAIVTSGATLLEGIAAYAIVDAVMYYLACRSGRGNRTMNSKRGLMAVLVGVAPAALWAEPVGRIDSVAPERGWNRLACQQRLWPRFAREPAEGGRLRCRQTS